MQVVETMHAAGRYDGRIRNLDTLNCGVGGHIHAHIQDRDSNRQIETVGKTESAHQSSLMNLEIYSVLGGNEVLSNGRYAFAVANNAGDVIRIRTGTSLRFMAEDGAKIPQIDPVQTIKIKVLVADSDKQFVPANGLSSLRQNGSEILGCFRHDSEGWIESEDEPRSRRGNRYLADLSANLGGQRRKT